jgi:hypothetical protein
MNRFFDRMRHPAAFKLGPEDAVNGSFEALRGKKYGVFVTFRRSGEAVPSPVWFAVDDQGRAYVRTMHDCGKVKRIRSNGRALLAPCTSRGKPTGPAVAGTARELPKDEWAHAEATLAAAYGMGRRIYEGMVGEAEGLETYIEIAPQGPAT